MSFQENIVARSPMGPIVNSDLHYYRQYPQEIRHRRLGRGIICACETALAPKVIPPEDLEVITKIYFREYANCGRKTQNLKRTIKHFKHTQPIERFQQKFLNFLKRK